uniref:Uncharacterized protein n=1 Tax=Glossina morsitans morsitans TaxID=37546 RepID=A0A1B0G6N7_GLOMM
MITLEGILARYCLQILLVLRCHQFEYPGIAFSLHFEERYGVDKAKSSCEPTCESRFGLLCEPTLKITLIEGCFCEEGYTRFGLTRTCIPSERCPSYTGQEKQEEEEEVLNQ